VILTPNILARMVAIVLLGVILQLSFFSQVALFHVAPDVLPALVISLGLLGGSLTGAVCGFSVGFLLDCLLIAPLGGGSLVLLTTGYLAGLFRERFEIDNQLMVPLLCVAGTLFAELGFGAVQLMLGIDAPISTLVFRDMLIKSAFAFFLGWPIYIGVKRALRPALVEEPEARRGRRLRPRGTGRRRRGPGRRRRTPTVMGV
jgi:rod shape-determining protein MreD